MVPVFRWNMLRSGLAAWVLVGVLLAGCLGDEGAAPEVPADGPDDAPGTGSIEGQVRDSVSFDPLAGVRILLVEDDTLHKETTSDQDGEFLMEGLPPGEYRLQTTSVTHRSSVHAVTVQPGDSARLDLLLDPFPTQRPFSDPLHFEGLMALGTHNPAFAMTSGLEDPNHQVVFNATVDPSLLATMIVELYWDESHVGLRANLWKNPNCDPVCSPDHDYSGNAEGDIQGFGQIQYRVDFEPGKWPALEGDEDVLSVQVWAERDEELATLAFQQRFEVFIETFYVEPAPPGYVSAPDR